MGKATIAAGSWAGKMLGIVMIIVMLLIANFIAQRILPTLRTDMIGKRFVFHYLVVFIVAGMVLSIIAVVTVMGW